MPACDRGADLWLRQDTFTSQRYSRCRALTYTLTLRTHLLAYRPDCRKAGTPATTPLRSNSARLRMADFGAAPAASSPPC